MRNRAWIALASSLVAMGCGGAIAPAGTASEPPARSAEARHSTSASTQSATPASGGSSDGTTCEQARDQYTEEINIQAGGPADLKAEDFAAVLNHGSYLHPCDVPTASKVRVCAAVQNGRAVGVTVVLDPPSPDTEVCVAGQVRQLSFPLHAKMDIVTVTF